MIRIGDRVIVLDKCSHAYMRSRCVIGINGDRLTLSGGGCDVECNICDILPEDTFLAIIGHGVQSKARLQRALHHIERIMGDTIDYVISGARVDIDIGRIDAETAYNVLEAFFDMLTHLDRVRSILGERAGIHIDRCDHPAISKACDEIRMLMSMVLESTDDCGFREHLGDDNE